MSIQVYEGLGGIDPHPGWGGVVWEWNEPNPRKSWHGKFRGMQLSISPIKSRTKWQWAFGDNRKGFSVVRGKELNSREEAYKALLEYLKDHE